MVGGRLGGLEGKTVRMQVLQLFRTVGTSGSLVKRWTDVKEGDHGDGEMRFGGNSDGPTDVTYGFTRGRD